MTKIIDPSVLSAGMTVAERLRAAETAIDQALIAMSELNGAMPQARIEAEVAAECGHRAMEHASESQHLMMQARGRLITAHKMLAKTSEGLGFEPQAFGGIYGKPDARSTSQQPMLREVRKRAA